VHIFNRSRGMDRVGRSARRRRRAALMEKSMSLDKMKKQAKNLRRLLPDFMREHTGELQLSPCLELVARSHGFPNWHAASSLSPTSPPVHGKVTTSPAFVVLPLNLEYDVQQIVEYSESGTEKPAREHRFLHIDVAASIEDVSDELSDFMEETGLLDWETPPADMSLQLVALCERLVRVQPAFLDGYAHLAVGLLHLGEYDRVLERLLPLYEGVVGAFPDGKKFAGRISYAYLTNRPFHRIAANLVIAAYRSRTARGDKLGAAIARQMYGWWPNDNIGFRFMLSASDFTKANEEQWRR
jgi:hypothetical protein